MQDPKDKTVYVSDDLPDYDIDPADLESPFEDDEELYDFISE